MLTFLVIEDHNPKMRQIVESLRLSYGGCSILERRSYQSGLKAALLEKPDIVVLDMTMPTFDVGGKETGGRERRYAGRQIFNQLRRKDSASQVVIVTQFERFGDGDDAISLDELKRSLEAEEHTNYLGIVYYQAADSRWRDELRQAIDIGVARTQTEGDNHA